ncbi:hypothetical protein [Phreatobacter sp.]|uniref:hypothetical protein n=1 Tax=Phreatobacter sp. TaxID=1966341 RepID=UPI003F6EB8C3
MNPSSVAAPDPSLVKDALRRIFDSSCLQEGSLPGKVLAYVVDRTLAGDGRSIKAYTIAVEGLGRGSDFDPDRDSTVRVAAMRLRGALDLYYAGPGAADPLKIRLVPGSYRPSFDLADSEEDDASLPVEAAPVATGSRVPSLAALVETGRRAGNAGRSTRWWLAAVTVALTIDILVTASLLAAQVAGRGREAAPAMAVEKIDPADAKPILFTLINAGIERSFRTDNP